MRAIRSAALAAIATIAAGGLGLAGAAGRQMPQMVERVDVARVVVDVHVLDDGGRPVRGLKPLDFRAWVNGTPVRIETVTWTTEAIADRPPGGSPPGQATGRPGERELPRGRLIVLLVQRDLEASRFEGLVNVLRRAQSFIDGLHPDDWIAVLAFEHHLQLRTDFTRDRAVVRDLVEKRLLVSAPSPTVTPDGPSLAAGLDADAGRKASSMEQALLVTARALDAVPGAKSLVVVGHGFGRILAGSDLRAPVVSVDPEYREAARLLMRARTTAYALDVTQADAHTMSAGLELVAADTGGFYVRTYRWPGVALSRLAEALAGRYELSIEKPRLPRGEHRIRIELAGRKGRVLARRTYVG